MMFKAFALGVAVLLSPLAAQETATRPRITGVAHAAFYVTDMAKARAFYEGFLGYASPYSSSYDGTPGAAVTIKINDRQTVELLPGPKGSPGTDRLHHFAIETENAEAMRRFLQSKDIDVPGEVGLDEQGNKAFSIKDPNGNTVQILEYLPEGWARREQGKYLPDTRIAPRMSHVGVIVGDFARSMQFYGELLGFRDIWRGSAGGKTLNWVNMQVPDGQDYVEFMLYDKYPTTDRLRTMHHICLEVADIEQALVSRRDRPYPPESKRPSDLKAGVNGKRQVNYYDPDGTRVEIMEPNTFDGLPRPPSPAEPPVPEKSVRKEEIRSAEKKK